MVTEAVPTAEDSEGRPWVWRVGWNERFAHAKEEGLRVAVADEDRERSPSNRRGVQGEKKQYRESLFASEAGSVFQGDESKPPTVSTRGHLVLIPRRADSQAEQRDRTKTTLPRCGVVWFADTRWLYCSISCAVANTMDRKSHMASLASSRHASLLESQAPSLAPIKRHRIVRVSHIIIRACRGGHKPRGTGPVLCSQLVTHDGRPGRSRHPTKLPADLEARDTRGRGG